MNEFLLSCRPWLRPLLCLALLCLGAPAQAQAPAPLNAAAIQAGPLALGPQVQLLEDPGRTLAWDEVVEDRSLPWRASTMAVLNFSFSRSTWWVRLALENPTAEPMTRVLELAMPLQDDVQVRWAVAGQAPRSWHTGDRQPFGQRPVPYRYPVFRLDLPAHSQGQLWLRLDTHDGLFEAIPLKLWQPDAFVDHGLTETLLLGAYFGANALLMIYMLVAGWLSRERIFVLYALYLGSFLFWNFSFLGFGFAYFWPNSPKFNNVVLGVSAVAIFASLTAFASSFMQTQRQAPRWHRVNLVLLALVALHLVPSLLDWYAATFRTLLPVSGLLLVTLLSTAVVLAWRGQAEARLYLLAWAFLGLGVIVYDLRVFGLLPSTPLVEYALNIGSILEMLLLALILSWRIHDLKQQALRAQQQQIESQRTMTARLEAEVTQRTAELQLANERLHQLSTTDALTGLLNRRSFDEALQLAGKHAQREGEPLALTILDVDHFKRINDSLGHQAGDAVLAQVAALLREVLRRDTDRVFRLGGEEFAVLLSGQAALQAQARVDQIRQRVQAECAVTISAGICVWQAMAGDTALSPRDLYHQADQAMYDAKGQGRNRVVLRHPGRR